MQALPHIDTRFERLEPFTRPAPHPMRVGLIATLVYLARRDFAERGYEPYTLIEAEVAAGLRQVEDLSLAEYGRHSPHVGDLPECGGCGEWIHPVGVVDGRVVYDRGCAYCRGQIWQYRPWDADRYAMPIGLVTAS